MNAHTFSGFILAVMFFMAVFAFARVQLTPENPHKAIDDYMKSFERLIEQVETLDPTLEQNFSNLAQNSKEFAITAERLQKNEVWTKNDSAMLTILNARYDIAVQRLVSGNLASGKAVSFTRLQ
ncbi:MAG: hypothetical protein II811_04445 [Spirochaetaceae bacterium]|nr:hypothetical protein [Spirochaetaceae bacterium]